MFDDAIFLIKWAEKIELILPNDTLKLSIKNKKKQKFLEIEGNKIWKKRLKKINGYEKH